MKTHVVTLIVGALAFIAGCKAQPCTNEDSVNPISTVECPARHLCYQSECVAACNAGSDRSESCEEDSDCSDPARPMCVDRACTACEEGTSCIPTLNICRPVLTNQADGGSRDANDLPSANTPLDGGFIDGSVFARDAGEEMPLQAIPPSHFVTIDIAQITRYENGRTTRSSALGIDVLDLSMGATRVDSATVAEPSLQDDVRCEVLSNVLITGTATSANVGTINLRNPETNPGLRPIDTNYVGRFEGGRYVVTPAPPDDFFVFSSSTAFTSVTFSGTGNSGLTIEAFPAGGAESLHIPAALQPGQNGGDNTPALLESGVTVPSPALDKIVLLWNFADNLRFNGVLVFARVDGPNASIRCVAADSKERIEIVARLLDTFRAMNGAGTYELVFERVFSQQINVDSDVDQGVLVNMTVAARNSLITPIVFQ